MVDETAASDSGRRSVSRDALKNAIFDALLSEFMFDSLHHRGAIPDPDKAASCVSEEVCASLERLFKRERLDLSIRRNVPYTELGTTDCGDSGPIHQNKSSQSVASVVIFDAPGRYPLHVLEIVAQWDRARCLELVHRLASLPRARRISDATPATVQWAGLACYHTHGGDPQEPPWFDLDGAPSLSDEIEAAVKFEFAPETSVSAGLAAPEVETSAFDRWGDPSRGYGNGSVTVALIEFNAMSED